MSSVLRVVRVHPEAVLPERKTNQSAGYDIASIEEVEIPPRAHRLVRTGIAFTVPEGTYGQLAPRSGLSCKRCKRPIAEKGGLVAPVVKPFRCMHLKDFSTYILSLLPMQHQDFTPVVFTRFRPTDPNRPSKHPHPITHELAQQRRLESNDAPPTRRPIGSVLGKQIQTARRARGYTTQQELARRLCVPVHVITGYESGKAYPSPEILQKLRSTLQIPLKLQKC
jgi:DNA-binding transcriptional regulator YiaG